MVTMTLPLSMVLQNVVVVAEGDQFWGVPEASVEASMPIATAEFTGRNGGREVRFESAAVPVVSLSSAVGGEGGDDDASEILVVNTRSGLVAVTVSEIIDRRRVAVKNLGPIIEGSGAIKGAALLGGGQVLVVLEDLPVDHAAARVGVVAGESFRVDQHEIGLRTGIHPSGVDAEELRRFAREPPL